MKSKFILMLLISAALIQIFSGCTAADTVVEGIKTTSVSSEASEATTEAEESTETIESSVQETAAASSNTTEAPETSVPETTTTSAKTSEASIAIDCRIAAEAGIDAAPEDGVILEQQIVEIEENETAFEFLKRVCRQEGILLSFKGSGRLLFVTGIAGLNAINAKSGWMFSVNGEFLMVGAGSYVVRENDIIVWHYTMDSGKDLE